MNTRCPLANGLFQQRPRVHGRRKRNSSGPGRRVLFAGMVAWTGLSVALAVGCKKELPTSAGTASSGPAARGAKKVAWPPRLTSQTGGGLDDADPGELVLEVSAEDSIKYKGFLRPQNFEWLPWREEATWSQDVTTGCLVSRVGKLEKRARFKAVGLVFFDAGRARALCRTLVLTEGELLIPNPLLLEEVPGVYVENDYDLEAFGSALTLIRLHAGRSALGVVEQADQGLFITAGCPGTRVHVLEGMTYERRDDGWYADGVRVTFAPTLRPVVIDPPDVTNMYQMAPGNYPAHRALVGAHGRIIEKGAVIVGQEGGTARDWNGRMWIAGDMLRYVEGELYGFAQVTDWNPAGNFRFESQSK